MYGNCSIFIESAFYGSTSRASPCSLEFPSAAGQARLNGVPRQRSMYICLCRRQPMSLSPFCQEESRLGREILVALYVNCTQCIAIKPTIFSTVWHLQTVRRKSSLVGMSRTVQVRILVLCIVGWLFAKQHIDDNLTERSSMESWECYETNISFTPIPPFCRQICLSSKKNICVTSV